MIKKRSSTKYITTIPEGSGLVVAMINYNNYVLLACEHHVYQLGADSIFRRIKFEEVKSGDDV